MVMFRVLTLTLTLGLALSFSNVVKKGPKVARGRFRNPERDRSVPRMCVADSWLLPACQWTSGGVAGVCRLARAEPSDPDPDHPPPSPSPPQWLRIRVWHTHSLPHARTSSHTVHA